MTTDAGAPLRDLVTTLRGHTVAVHDERNRGSGSGVLWTAGIVVTNAHVVSGRAPTIVLADGRRARASLVARDPQRDLAIVRLPDEFRAHARAAVLKRDSTTLVPGELVVAVGHPHGIAGAAAAGIVHRCNARWVMADVRLAPGNSGGPLADATGRVVGINSMIASGLALAVPSAAVAAFLRAIGEGRARGVIRTLVSAETDFARAGLASIVSNDARLILVGESAPGDLAAMIARSSPDVILEDRGDEPESTRVPRVALVDDPRAAWIGRQLEGESADSGAILARDASSDQIVAAIVAVAAGLVALAPRAIFAREPLAEAVSAANERATGTERLTQRERDILGEVARGAPNKIIAARLGISEHTVKFHIGSIFAKLDVTSRTEAVTRGIRLGLVML